MNTKPLKKLARLSYYEASIYLKILLTSEHKKGFLLQTLCLCSQKERENMEKEKSLSMPSRGKLIASVVALPLIIAAGVGLGVANSLGFNEYANTLTTYLCKAPEDEARTTSVPGMGDELAVECEREGIVLLQNKDNTLPLTKSEVQKVNVFGHGSIDWYIMSSG